jgi:hypothetical protein
MGSEPGGNGCTRPVRQDLDQAMGLQVYDERSVRAATPKSKVIQADLRECFRASKGGTFLTAQEGGWGPLHSQMRSQA